MELLFKKTLSQTLQSFFFLLIFFFNFFFFFSFSVVIAQSYEWTVCEKERDRRGSETNIKVHFIKRRTEMHSSYGTHFIWKQEWKCETRERVRKSKDERGREKRKNCYYTMVSNLSIHILILIHTSHIYTTLTYTEVNVLFVSKKYDELEHLFVLGWNLNTTTLLK